MSVWCTTLCYLVHSNVGLNKYGINSIFNFNGCFWQTMSNTNQVFVSLFFVVLCYLSCFVFVLLIILAAISFVMLMYSNNFLSSRHAARITVWMWRIIQPNNCLSSSSAGKQTKMDVIVSEQYMSNWDKISWMSTFLWFCTGCFIATTVFFFIILCPLILSKHITVLWLLYDFKWILWFFKFKCMPL